MLSEKLYRALLFAYPRKHRREYGELMVQMFRDRMRRDGGGFGSIKVWFDMLVDLVVELSRRHIYLYEKITGRSFEFPEADQPIETRLESNLEGIT